VTVRRAAAVLAAAVLFAVTACSGEPRTTWVWPGAETQGPAASASPTASATPSAPIANGPPLNSPVIINQSHSGPGERRLAIEVDGAWTCENCAGDGKNSAGRLTAAQMKQLQTFLDDPAFGAEDGVPATSPKCGNKLDSNLTTSQGVVLWSNCKGGGPPPVALKILRLLAEVTPLDAGLPK
jgi:hypothetical protein